MRNGDVYVPGGEEPTLTRYRADESGALVASDTISFAGVGLSGTSATARTRLVSDHKAYTFDETNLVIHIWDPVKMRLTGESIDFSEIAVPGQQAWVSVTENSARQRGDLLFVPVGWYENEPPYPSRPVAGLLVIDTASDTLVSFSEDDRCPGLESSVVNQAGDLYFGFTAAATILDVRVTHPDQSSCSLRVRQGDTRFDPEYFLDLSAITGGRVACCGASGGNSTAYVQVLHEERTGIDDPTELFGSAHNDWRLWRIDLERQTGEEVESYPWFATSGPNAYELADGRTLTPLLVLDGERGGLFSNAGRTSTLVDLTTEHEPTPTLWSRGSILGFGRLR